MNLVAESWDQLYVEIAKLKPHDRQHVMRCLKNRKRVWDKKMASAQTLATETNHQTIVHN